MTFSNTKALDLLGKDVSFINDHKVVLNERSAVTYHETVTGTVTQVLIHLDSPFQFAVNNGDFYNSDVVQDLSVKS